MAAKTNTWRKVWLGAKFCHVIGPLAWQKMGCHVIRSGLREPTRTERTTARRLPAIFDRSSRSSWLSTRINHSICMGHWREHRYTTYWFSQSRNGHWRCRWGAINVRTSNFAEELA